MSSEEIEDVVSSVRRLVSNEQSSRRVTRDLGAERLILTPALRVVSETSPLSPLLSPLILDGAAPESPEQHHTAPAIEAEVQADDAAPIPPAEPDVDLVEAEWEDEIWVAPEAVSLGEVALAAEEAEVLVPPVDSAAADAQDIATEVDDTGEAWAQSDWSEDEPVPFIPLRRRAEHLAARLAAGEVMDIDDPDDVIEDDAAATLAPDVAPDVAPELLEDDALAVDIDEETPVAPGLPEDDAKGAAQQRMPTEILDADGTPLAVLDEAALQEIVRQMIREELQGSLGERITRNVRKLVRAEINRALIARDLD